MTADDLFETPLDQAEIDFENEGGETYICGNPPYLGSQRQSPGQKADLQAVFAVRVRNWKSLDYVAAWFMKATDYGMRTLASAAFVATNSLCQGRQVESLWTLILSTGHEIAFAHTSFKWANLATHNAGVMVVIVGISNHAGPVRRLFSESGRNEAAVRTVQNINAYLTAGPDVAVRPAVRARVGVANMNFGNMPNDGGELLLDMAAAAAAIQDHSVPRTFIRPFVGAKELIRGAERRCIWIDASDYARASSNPWFARHFEAVRAYRAASSRSTTRSLASVPYQFGEVRQSGGEVSFVIPRHSSENREYLPVGIRPPGTIVADSAFAFFDEPLWNVAIFTSRLHLAWVATVCGKLKTDFRYSNTLGWNTFPVPTLTEQNKVDLTHCAEEILLAREHYFPATIADMYAPERMDKEFPRVREAHDRNDEVLERIYIGRRFKNDTERLEKLFDLYTEMTTAGNAVNKRETAQ